MLYPCGLFEIGLTREALNMRIWGLILTSLLWMQWAHAVPVNGLYKARVEVLDQTEEQRNSAFVSGLRQILVKVSGDKDAGTRADLEKYLKISSSYVQRFSYDVETYLPEPDAKIETVEVSVEHAMKSPENEPVSSEVAPITRYWLNLEYSALAINQLLQNVGLPVWGYNRPALVAWVAIEEDGQREILNAEQESDITKALRGRAEERGLPVYFPVLDIQDVQAVSLSDVWGLFADPVLKASSRYRADTVVIVRIYKTLDGVWQVQWLHDLKGEQTQIAMESEELSLLMVDFVDQLADRLARRYSVAAQSSSDSNQLEIQVDDVLTFDDYIRLTRYLQSLAPVDAVRVTEIRARSLRFNVELKGSQEQFQEHLELDRLLLPSVFAVDQADDGFRSYYRWDHSTNHI